MRAARRIIGLALAAGCLACGAYLGLRGRDEARLEDANDLAAAGRYADAARAARRVDGAGVRSRAARLEGYALLSQRRAEEAIAPLRRVLSDEPNDWRVRRDIAFALALLGRRAEARREFERAVALNPRLQPLPGFAVRRARR